MRGPPWGKGSPADEAVVARRVVAVLRELVAEGLLYAQAAQKSMRDSDHEPTAQVFVDLLRSAPGSR